MNYVVTCSRCGSVVLVTGRISEPEASAMLQHLCDRHPEMVKQASALGDLLTHFAVSASSRIGPD